MSECRCWMVSKVLPVFLLLDLSISMAAGPSAPDNPLRRGGVATRENHALALAPLNESQQALEACFREAAGRLQHLRGDSARTSTGDRSRLSAGLQEAAILLDDVHYRLSELRNLESAGKLAEWRALHERTEKSLFGLHRFFGHVESLRDPLAPGAAPPISRSVLDTL